jgi:hypothetical protein
LNASIANGSFTLPEIAPTGQTLEHFEHPLHFAGSMDIRVSFLQLPAGQRFSFM